MYLKPQKYIKGDQWLTYLLNKSYVDHYPNSEHWGDKIVLWKPGHKICLIFNNSSVHCSIYWNLTIRRWTCYVSAVTQSNIVPYSSEIEQSAAELLSRLGLWEKWATFWVKTKNNHRTLDVDVLTFRYDCSIQSASKATVVENRGQFFIIWPPVKFSRGMAKISEWVP